MPGADLPRRADPRAWTAPARTTSPRGRASLAGRGAAVVIATHDVEFAASFAERVVLLGDGELIADGPAAEVLSGGWYFATEVARILGVGGAIPPERGGRAPARADGRGGGPGREAP